MFIISLSGGLDSAVLCAWLVTLHGPESVRPVFFTYGSKHNAWENQAAQSIAQHFDLHLQEVDLRPAFSGISSALLAHDSRSIPSGEYDKQNMEMTAVPGRNLLFASVLASIAESNGGGTISLATHSGDHHLYPDCRPAFNHSLADTIRKSSGNTVTLDMPFENLTKADIVAKGLRLDAPLHLTRSCYQSDALSCGTCGTCRERLEAFAANGVADPIPYMK